MFQGGAYISSWGCLGRQQPLFELPSRIMCRPYLGGELYRCENALYGKFGADPIEL